MATHALVAAALEHRNRLRAAELETWLAGADETEQRSLVMLDWYQRDGQRGCGFLNDLTSGPNLLATFMAFPRPSLTASQRGECRCRITAVFAGFVLSAAQLGRIRRSGDRPKPCVG